MTSKEMMKHFEVYYKIAGQRLADQIPLVIRYQMLQEFANELQCKMLDTFTNKERKEYLLEENSGTKNKREDLKMRLERLSRAHILLSEFSRNTTLTEVKNFNSMENFYQISNLAAQCTRSDLTAIFPRVPRIESVGYCTYNHL